jgi:hypothetical protein
MLAGRWLRVVCLSCFLSAVAGTARAAGVDLKALESVAIPEQPAELEKLATTLAGLMKEAYGVDLQVVRTAAPGKGPAILLDRALAIGSGKKCAPAPPFRGPGRRYKPDRIKGLKGSGTNCRNGPKGAAHNWYLTPF